MIVQIHINCTYKGQCIQIWFYCMNQISRLQYSATSIVSKMRGKGLAITLLVYLISVNCQFTPKTDIGCPPKAFQMDFSSDKKYLAIATPSTLSIYQSQTLKKLQTLYYQQFNIASFAFNRDSTMLIIGSDTGQAYLYKHINNNFTQSKKFKYANQTTIKSVCFTSNSKSIVLGFEQSQVVVWSHQSDTMISTDFMNQFVHTVSCSPIEPNLFVVGGSGNTISKFTFYTIQAEQITVKHDVVTQPDTEIYGSTFSSDGQTAYRVGSQGLLYKYKVSTFQEESSSIFETNQTLTKIRVNQNQRLIAAAYKGKVVIVTQNNNGIDQNSIKDNLVQTYQVTVDSVALSNKGSNLFFVYYQKGYLYGECPFSQFANKDGTCIDCSSICNVCEQAENICYGCIPRYYLAQTTCQHCPQGCSTCTSAHKCQTCNQGYVLDGQLCSSDHGNIALYFSLAVGGVFIGISLCVCIALVKKKSDPSTYNKM